MALEIRQTAKLVQQLVITPQLQQAIRLLQLTRLELVDLISQEMKENPLLEETEEGREVAEGEAPVAEQAEAEAAPEPEVTPEVKGTGEGVRRVRLGELFREFQPHPISEEFLRWGRKALV